MTDENIRLKALGLLKQKTAAFVDSYKSDKNEEYAVTRSSVYLNEYSKLITSQEYKNTIQKSQKIRPTKLQLSDIFQERDCAGTFDISCKYNEVSDQNVQDFVQPRKIINTSQEKGSIEEDSNKLLKSIWKSKDDIMDASNPNDDLNESVYTRDDKPCSNKIYSIFKDKQSEKLLNENKAPRNPFKIPKIMEESNNVMDVDKTFGSNCNTLKITNPWKEEKMKNVEIVKDKSFKNNECRALDLWKHEKTQKSYHFSEDIREIFNQFKSNSSLQSMAKENCNVNKKVEGQHSTKHDTFSNTDKDEDKKSNTQKVFNNPFSSFRTGNQELEWQKNLQKKPPQRGLSKKRAPYTDEKISNDDIDPLKKKFHCPSYPKQDMKNHEQANDLPENLKGLDKGILERIQRDIVVDSSEVSWDDIIGLDGAKRVIKESVILAIKRPDLFTGLRESSRAIMLFGPPGTGKTLIGKCIASSCNATFMSVSASSLTSKWIGESETLVRAMFTYAKFKQPCVIFFDEIDSLLEKRSDQANEAFNRIKTEFLVQLDGANALKATDNVLLIGATNRPDVIDEAILRRFTKRILVPLPVKQARINMFRHLLSKHCHTLTDNHIEKLSNHCDKYSGSDIAQVCKEAAMMSIRRLDSATLESMKADDIPPISPKDFIKALRNVKPTVSEETIKKLDEWNEKFGLSVDDNDFTIDEGDFFEDSFGDF